METIKTIKSFKSKIKRTLSRGSSLSRSDKSSESDGERDLRDRGPRDSERITNIKDSPHLSYHLHTDYVYVKTTSYMSSDNLKAKHVGYLGVKDKETDIIFILKDHITEIDDSEYIWVKNNSITGEDELGRYVTFIRMLEKDL